VRRKGIPDSSVIFPWLVYPLGDIRPMIVSRAPWQKYLTTLEVVFTLLVLVIYSLTWLNKGIAFKFRTPCGH